MRHADGPMLDGSTRRGGEVNPMHDYNVCYLPVGIIDHPTIVGEDHITLEDALEAALDFARTVRAAGQPLPSIWVETDDFRFELHVKPGRIYRWEVSLETTQPDESGETMVFYGAPDDIPRWTRRELVKFWDERERGEHRASFPCAWDECDGFSRDLEPLMRDRYGVVYECRKCHQWTDSNCPAEPPLRPYRTTRASALA
jgi:hypothetical protein